MDEQKNLEETMVRNDEYEAFEASDEMIEESANKSVESKQEDREEQNESAEVPVEYTPLPEKTKKHLKAKNLIQKAKKMADEANRRRAECRLLLDAGLRSYQEARAALHLGGLDACITLLKQLGARSNNDEEAKAEAVLETREALKPMVVKDISSGRVTGFLLALLGGVAAAAGMLYLATSKLEMRLDTTKVPSENEIDSILAWFSTIIGVREDVAIGTGVLGVIVLSVMILIYMVRIRLKTKSNIHFAVKQFVEAELYAEQNPNCREEMEKVDAHIQDVIGTLKAYGILLNEQEGKLQRIVYFEGEKETGVVYLDNSLAEIEHTKGLIDAVQDLITIPVVEEEKISDESVCALQKAKEKLYTVIERFY